MADGMFGAWGRLMARPNTDRTKTVAVAGLVALACGLAVSVTAVSLRPTIQANVEAQRQARMSQMLAALPGIGEILIDAGADAIETLVVELDTGRVTDISPDLFDAEATAADPGTSRALSRAEDLAGIGRRENFASVNLLRRDGEVALVVLPVYANGYQSTIRAYLALEADLNTVAGLSVYAQGETPGLGDRIMDPGWQAQWAGKEVAADGQIVIEVVRGSGSGPHEVDGISGASVTGYAVTDMIHFWMGPLGFAPFLEALAAGEIE